jgi:hypothetical protein
MKKFDYKKFLKENKSTFYASLNEGQFSWMTQDTGQQIGSQDANKIPVYMFDNKGKYWFERDYEGYGVFGGKDYYELLDQMNGGSGNRSKGIDLAFDKSKEGKTLFPALVVGPSNFNYKTHDFTQEAEHDPNQSWYDASYEEEDEDEDYGGFGDMDREEDYDYSDGEELDEAMNMNKDASGIARKFAQYMSKKEGKKFTVTPGSIDEKSFDLDLDGEKYMGGSYLVKDNGDIVNVAMGNKVYGNIAQLDEGEAAYEYEKGKKAGKKIEKKKMKVSELKAKIKDNIHEILSEESINEKRTIYKSGEYEEINSALDDIMGNLYVFNDDDSNQIVNYVSNIKDLVRKNGIETIDESEGGNETSEYDFLKEIEEMLNEAEDDEEVDAEAAADAGAEEEIDTTVDITTDEVDPNVKSVQDALTQAQAAAQQLGDKKLMDQIGNTITFFTRAHVVEKPKGAVAEGEKMEEGYFGANNEVEELIDALGYETMDEFFSDNPGVITAILDWAAGVPEFRRKMIDNGLLEAKKENMNESMFPMLKKILK